jgi:hypothetical protein
MREKIDGLALHIKKAYEELGRKANEARKADPQLASRMQRLPLSLSVCAVDGGILAQRMHGADIVLARAVGVNFVYENSKLKTFRHVPHKSPEPDIEIKSSLEEHESVVFRSLVRLRQELGCALSLMDLSPDLLLMDGSLLPLPSDRPPEESELRPLYSEVVSLYERLYAACGKTILCGVIKDSRSRKLSKELGMNCSDSLLCSFLLEEGERSGERPYFDDKTPNKDILSLGSRLRVFYMKPSRNDIPLRIEVLGDVEKAASMVYSLSAISDNFAYPAILVEADLCAAMDGSGMEGIEASLIRISGMKPLRRNSRPFR